MNAYAYHAWSIFMLKQNENIVDEYYKLTRMMPLHYLCDLFIARKFIQGAILTVLCVYDDNKYHFMAI